MCVLLSEYIAVLKFTLSQFTKSYSLPYVDIDQDKCSGKRNTFYTIYFCNILRSYTEHV